MNNSVRPELLEAYRHTVGLIRTPRTVYGAGKERPTAQQEAQTFSALVRSFPPLAQEKFRIHGLAKLVLNVSYASVEFIVDMKDLNKIAEPQEIWLSKQKPDELHLIVSSGKQSPGAKALSLPVGKNPEGIRITLTPKSRTQIPTPYEAEISPLYLA